MRVSNSKNAIVTVFNLATKYIVVAYCSRHKLGIYQYLRLRIRIRIHGHGSTRVEATLMINTKYLLVQSYNNNLSKGPAIYCCDSSV